jgi:hypothetical protein
MLVEKYTYSTFVQIMGLPQYAIISTLLQNTKINDHTNVEINKLYSQMLVMVFTPEIYFFNFVQVLTTKVSPSLQPCVSKFVSKRNQYLQHLKDLFSCTFYLVSDGKTFVRDELGTKWKNVLELTENFSIIIQSPQTEAA